MNYVFDKFCAKTSFESVNKSIYIYINQQILKRATTEFKTLSDLSKDEIENLEDEVINFIKVGANLVFFLSLVALSKIGYF